MNFLVFDPVFNRLQLKLIIMGMFNFEAETKVNGQNHQKWMVL